MSSLAPTSPPNHIWVIENAATGEWLGLSDRKSRDTFAEFGGRVPLFYQSLGAARAEWLRHSCEAGYIVRAVSLAGSGPRYSQGDKFGFWPKVKYRKLSFREEAVAIDTPDEMGVGR